MAHNIREDTFTKTLTIHEAEDHVGRVIFGDNHICVRGLDSDSTVWIHGEDLYAFRELLNELPEKAFVRPADPFEKPEWTDGDVLVDASNTVYTRDAGAWVSPGRFMPPIQDNIMTGIADHSGVRVLRQQSKEA